MIRKATAAVSIVLVGGLVVAMLSAEEPADSDERSVLTRKAPTAAVTAFEATPASGAEEEEDEPSAGRGREGGLTRPQLVDRLQKIRRNAVGSGTVTRRERGPSSLSVGRAPVAGPAEVDPAKQQPHAELLEESRPEPNLLPTQSATGREAAVSPQGVPARLDRSPAPVTRITDQSTSRRTREDEVDLSPAPVPPEITPVVPQRQVTIEESSGIPAFNPSREARVAERQVLASEQAIDSGALLSTVGAALRVDTRGPQAILIGREAEYELTLLNQSTIAANDVLVRIVIPAWVDIVAADASLGTTEVRGGELGGQHVMWNANQLSAGGQEKLALKVIPRENRPLHLAVDWTQRPAASVAEIHVQQPQLEMAVFGPREIQYGETAVYTIQLANPGTGPAEAVSVDFGYGSERLPTKEIGDLPAGGQTEIRVELTARQAGVLQVSAAALAEGGLRADASEDVLVRRAKLEVAVIGVPLKFAGTVATYEVRVSNVGDAAATDVATAIHLPPGANYVAQDQDTEVINGNLKRRLGTIAPGAERAFRIACQLTTAGDNVIEARAHGQVDLVAIDTFVTEVKALADLKLTVNDPKGPIAINSDALYELTVINRGTKAALDVRIIGQFSEGVEPVEAIGATARLIPGQVLFNPIGRVDPGEEIKLKIVARAGQQGNHRFRAEVKCSDPETTLVEEESTYFFGDDLSTAKAKRTERR